VRVMPGEEGPNSPGLPDYWNLWRDFPTRWLMNDAVEKQRNGDTERGMDGDICD